MDQNTKNCMVFEIDQMFANFYADNLERLSAQMPSMIVDGSVQPYRACLPKYVAWFLPSENKNPA